MADKKIQAAIPWYSGLAGAGRDKEFASLIAARINV
jgi:hypothetical protein